MDSPLRAISAPWYDTHTSTNASIIAFKYIIRYLPPSVLADPWADTPTPINASNRVKVLEVIPP